MKPEKLFSLTILLTGTVFLFPACLNLVMDPFFIYHKPYFMESPYFANEDRYQNAGIINSFLSDPNENYQNLIIGTSLSQNFKIDKNTIPLTLAGGRAKELAAMAQKAFATDEVKSVLWEIFFSYNDDNPDDTHPESPLPLYLYNDALWDDWRYVFNESVLQESIKIITDGNTERKNLDKLYHWGEKEKALMLDFQSPEKMAENKQLVKTKNLPFKIYPPEKLNSKTFPSVDQNLIPLIKENENIRFNLFFPPVSYLEYIKLGEMGFWKEMLMRRYVLEKTKNLKNVAIYQFDLIDGIGNDLSIYRDSQHYPSWVNDKIQKSVETGENRITLKKWADYSTELAKRINKFAEDFIK